MSKFAKLILSVLLVYVCVMTAILLDTGNSCANMFSIVFCHSISKWLLLGIPCVLTGIYFLWKRDIANSIDKLKQRNAVKSAKQKNKIKKDKQKAIGLLEALCRFVAECDNCLGVAKLSEFLWVCLVFFVALPIILSLVPYGFTVLGILQLILFLPFMFLCARRLHDVGISAKILFFPCIIFALNTLLAMWYYVMDIYVLYQAIGDCEIIYNTMLLYVFLLFVCMLLPSNKENNKYRNLKISDNHNKAWVTAAYVVCAAIIYLAISNLIR